MGGMNGHTGVLDDMALRVMLCLRLRVLWMGPKGRYPSSDPPYRLVGTDTMQPCAVGHRLVDSPQHYTLFPQSRTAGTGCMLTWCFSSVLALGLQPCWCHNSVLL